MEQTALFNALTQTLNNLTSSGTSHHDETATQTRETRIALMMVDNDIDKEIRELTEQLIALRKDIGKEKTSKPN